MANDIVILPPMSATAFRQVSTNREDIEKHRRAIVGKTCVITIPAAASGIDCDLYVMGSDVLAQSMTDASVQA